MDAKKAQDLKALLGTLPPIAAARLAKAIEIDRLNDGRSLPHDLILEGLRPTLRDRGQSERTFTPLRLFCRPFEDLLTTQPRKEKQKGRIARASAAPVWNWVSQALVPEAASAFAIAVKTAVLALRPEDAMSKAEAFWSVAAQAIYEALASERGRRTARGVLESDLVVADAREMGVMLSIGPDIVELQSKLPRPLPALTDDFIWMLREIYDRVAQSAPDAAAYIAVVAMQRLERPWEALKLPQSITRQTQDTLISSTDMGLVGEILFGDIEMHAAAICAARPTGFNADDLVTHLVGFTALSTGMVKAIEMRRDGKWGQRLMKDRTNVAGVMEGFMARAPKEVSMGLPTIKSGSYAGGPRVPDIAHAPDLERSDRALAYTRLTISCRSLASAASFAAANQEAIEQISVMLTSYSEDLLKELRAAEGPRRAHAEAFFNLAVELVSLMFSTEEAEFLRRRGRAALATPAAA